MTPSRTHFRLLLAIQVALMLASMAAGWSDPSPAFTLALEAEPDPLRDADPLLLIAMLCVLVTFMVASLAGLFAFRAWGRSLAWWSTVASLAAYPFLGVTVLSPVEGLLSEASSMSWGALLVLAYFSPLSREFLPARRGEQNGAAN